MNTYNLIGFQGQTQRPVFSNVN